MKSNRMKFAIATALAAFSVGVAADTAMGQEVRDNRRPTEVRDNRTSPEVRDNRTSPEVRDNRTSPEVRDNRTSPEVRDNRTVVRDNRDSVPRYRIEMSSFRAADESGRDSLGSDEPYWIASAVSGRGVRSTHMSKVFGDVDTGERRAFSGKDGCFFPRRCRSAAAARNGIGVSVQLIEQDQGSRLSILRQIEHAVGTFTGLELGTAVQWIRDSVPVIGDAVDFIGRALGDDVLGTQTFVISKERLERTLTRPGAVLRMTKRFGGLDTSAGADYDLTMKVTRVA